MDLNINNERQDSKIGMVYVGVLVREGRVNKGGEGEGIWWVDFIYLHEIEQRNLLQLL
jgi:hypothetical protein